MKMKLCTAAVLVGSMLSQSVLSAFQLPPNRSELNKVHVGREVELSTVDGATLVGRVVAFDGCRIELDSQLSEIHCDRIRAVKIIQPKRLKSPAMASHLTGGTKVVVLVAVAVGLVLVLGIVAAKNTR